jgi:beta-phosphoglucomutase-like phosphatase (HAD superfamily)
LTEPAVEAVVLDMDGLLVDTGPVWRAAESAVFAGLGIPLRSLVARVPQAT